MYTYDEIIANGYLVFGSELWTEIIQNLYRVLRALKIDYDRTNMKLDKLRDIFEFRDLKFVLKDGKTEAELAPYMNPNIIMLFKFIQHAHEEYQEETSKKYVKK